MQRYLFPILILPLSLFAAQNPPEPAKPQHKDVPTAVPTDAKPRDRDVPTAVPTDAKPATVPGVSITAEQWARPRHGAGIVQLPGVGALVEAVGRDAAARLAIRFASGDEGTLWAEELRSWLAALGLPSARIALEPGLPQSDRLLLELRQPPPR